jgi:hypothetical protein
MYKIRAITFSLILALFVPIVAIPVQVKAESNVSDLSRLAGTAAPVLTAITTCTLGLLFDKAKVKITTTINQATATVDSASVSTNPDVESNIGNTAESTERAKKRALCWVPIERAAAQVILNTITTETINWINGGMNGSPMYNQNLSKSLSKMQDNALVKLASDLSDPNSYPFGKEILKSTLAKFHNNYQKSSVSDLSASIDVDFPGKGIKDFSRDLLFGGWSAFDAGFKPNNNAIGFNFQTQDHIVAEFQGTAYSAAQSLKDELSWGHGFLSQKKCLDKNFPDDGSATTTDANGNEIPNVCPPDKTKIVTPGEVVSGKLSKALGNQEDALNLGQDLDASITSIFNAMITKLLQNGLASLSDDTGSNSSSDTTKNTTDTTAKQTIEGNATAGSLCGVASSDDWYKQYPKFNLWRDLSDSVSTSTDANGNPIINPGLITREKQLEYVLQAQNNMIKWIKKSIYELDLCIPGPHSLGNNSIKNKVYGDIMQNYNYPGSSSDQVNEIYNAQFLSDYLGVQFFPDSRLKSPTAVQKIIKTIISRYYDAMMSEYGNLNLIESYPKVQQYYKKIGFYDQQLADNEAKIALIEGNISQLRTLQNRISNIKGQIGVENPTNPGFLKVKQQFDALVPDLDVSPFVSKK